MKNTVFFVLLFLLFGTVGCGTDKVVTEMANETPSYEDNKVEIEPEKDPEKSTKSDAEKIEEIIFSKIGEKTNSGNDRIIGIDKEDGINITLAADENEDIEAVKKNIHLNTAEVVELLFLEFDIREVLIAWEMELKGSNDTSSMNRVMLITFTKRTAEKINWAGLSPDKIPEVASSYWVHPTLR